MNVFKELKNVTWPTGKELRKDAAIVIISIIVVAIFLGLVDQAANWFFNWFISL